MALYPPSTLRRRKRNEKIARWVVTIGGMTVIASVLAILILIAAQTLPLFLPARTERTVQRRLPAGVAIQDVIGLGCDLDIDGSGGAALVFLRNGTCRVLDLATGELLLQQSLTADQGNSASSLRSVRPIAPAAYALWWSDGSLSLAEFARPGGGTSVKYSLKLQPGLPAERGPPPLQAVVRRPNEHALAAALLMPDRRIVVIRQSAEENMLGELTTSAKRWCSTRICPRISRRMAIDAQATAVYAGTASGELLVWEFTPELRVRRHEQFPAFRDKRKITALALVLGDMTLAMGDERGTLTTWLPVHYTEGGERKLIMARELEPHAAAIREILPSGRTKSLLSCDEHALHLDHVTSQRHLATIVPQSPLKYTAFSARGNALLGLDTAGNLSAWSVHCPHPEVSWRTLFGKVLYEGYDQPQYVWQTTGGEDYEPKYSLVPLLFGTFKGTFYAMLLAVPLSLLGAIYVSQFTTPRFKAMIKPVVEIMAASPRW